MTRPCVFCQALSGELAVDKVWEDESTLAFLDHRPLFPGHVLLIPKRHCVTLIELLPQEVSQLFDRLRVFSQAVPRALQAEGCFVANNNRVSQSVPHVHWHIVPRRKGDGMKGFFWPRQPYQDEDHLKQVRANIEQCFLQELILDFWFGPPQASGLSHEAYRRRWFQQDPAFDNEIQARFKVLMDRALQGELQDWATSARGSLALLLLLDQFPRNLYRHTEKAFLGDPQAQALALEGIQQGLDRQLSLEERVFFYLPFEHGESIDWQTLSLKSFEELRLDAPESSRGGFEQYLEYAKRHAQVIQRFHRYPHRNQALGRKSTPEEEEFLQDPAASFW